MAHRATDALGHVPREGHTFAHARRHGKTIKAPEGKMRYVLCYDIYMDRVGALCSRYLVGRLEYCSMGKKECVEWETVHWNPILTYVPTIILLANKWLVFIVLCDSDPELALED